MIEVTSVQDRPSWAPEGVDLDRPNVARIYDYYLGGAHNFEKDREFARNIVKMVPEVQHAARLNRAFLRRAVKFCVDNGIRQFLDVGSGIPTVGNVHEIAQGADPTAKVVYVDVESVAVAHSELILKDNPNAAVLQADFREPEAILGSEVVRELIDPNKPTALLLAAVLHFVQDADAPREKVRQYVDWLTPGSYLVLSHGTKEDEGDPANKAEQAYQSTSAQYVDRGKAAITEFFAGTELLDPGVVYAPQWHPDSPEDVGEHPEQSHIYAGVGLKR
ncbi:S-adenosyl methyltransferase [Herbihabitans rhizosphaerae]|uniref:S-adenosyl methyltransferase n=1 Tax=Herbihabitans rhizosphaerae TaxID=1872711 RepID=A0A4Q7KJ14_9PSEU|nr:SAM-dependent methyltransferase [Herbihabitans rhizosphaerae]RZS36539.1 S-adenosyl methyltransferase [Herbihabitans rhizosphaerae]